MAQAGTTRSLKIDGENFDIFGDSDLDRMAVQVTEMIVSTGASMAKVTKQNPNVTGVDILVDGAQRSRILDIAEGTTEVDLAYTTANGDSYTASGRINITSDTTQDAKITVDLMPVQGWTEILV